MIVDKDAFDLLIKKHGFSPLSLQVALNADFKCEYCDLDLLQNITHYDLFQLDHLYPQSKNLDDSPENLVLSCSLCNKLKRNHFPEHLNSKSRDDRILYFRGFIAQKRAIKEQDLADLSKKLQDSFNTPKSRINKRT